ncbi:hypothetical protein [Acinetobacter baumannii]|uniref:hypothetical protein n=1 Tax=Acinetobacter baumannii TaxID=470 RepID=UPI003AF969B7
MIFGQSASNTALFVYQFILPFATETAKVIRLKQQVKSLLKQKPGKHKGKQQEFKKLYVKIWKQIIEFLKTDWALRASVHYIPQLQLIRELDSYIDPEVQPDALGQARPFSGFFFTTLFGLRNTDTKQQVIEILEMKYQVNSRIE